MSVKVMARVWDSDLAPNHKLVLLAYADAANDDGTKSYPGEDRVATMTGYSVSQIRRVTRELIEAGHLARVKRGYRGQRAEFAVTLKGAQSATHSEGESLANDAEKPSDDASPPVQTHPKNLTTFGSRPDPEETDRIGVWTALEDLFGEPAETDRKLRGKVLRSLLKAGATHSEVHRRAEVWPKLFPASNGGKPPTLTVTALEKHWGQLGKLLEDIPEPFDPENCDHPDDRVSFVEDTPYCGMCSRELETA